MRKNHPKKDTSPFEMLIGLVLWLVIISFLFGTRPLFAQVGTAENVNLEMNDIKVSTLLNKLKDDYNLNLSYNAGDAAFDKIVSFKAKDKTVEEVLSTVLQMIGYQFKNIDNQFVIFSMKIPAETDNTVSQPPIILKKIQQPTSDTIFIDRLILKTDTLVRINTIIKRDTVIHTDTITIYKETVPEKVSGKIKNIRADVFNNDTRRNKGWAFGFSYGRLLTDYKITGIGNEKTLPDLIDKSEHWSFRSNILSVNAYYNFNRFKAGATVDFSSITSKFNFNKVTSTGGLFDVDTLDSYYTITGIDTNWVYIQDSTWVPVNRTEYYYSQINSLSYLNFQLNAAYAVVHNRNFELCLQAGISLNHLLSAKGSTIDKSFDYEVINFNEIEFNKTNYSYHLGIGMRYKLNDAIDINPEIYYFNQINEIYQSQFVKSKLYGFGLKLGIIYYM
jgi:hypothetical protein